MTPAIVSEAIVWGPPVKLDLLLRDIIDYKY